MREGLDIPEVSLVAILDADKEGFLRSERALIQTIGRAARNSAGKAILYADSITRSMQAAITETQRRRDKQSAYNQKYHITPTSIRTKVPDIMQANYTVSAKSSNLTAIAEQSGDYMELDAAKASKKIKQLEKQMLLHAENLEFEIATKIRDQIAAIKAGVFGV